MTEDTRLRDTAGSAARTAARPRAAVRAFRPRRTIPAMIASIALLAAGVLTALEVIMALWGRPAQIVPIDDLNRWAAATTWQDRAALGSAGLATLLGLLLLLIAWVAGRPRVVALRTDDPDLVAGVSPRMLANLLGDAAGRVDGVRRARAKVRGRHVTVQATTDLRDAAEMEERVRAAVEREIATLAPVARYTVRARVRTPR
ncbi:hypothetical protein Pth03_78460 [Planotetraspora thailandica]|uniref:DUF6286 domain-containing protein n=1 Tax=Planotetraspora thailandica TaxID=487172 RepID=A0A8J3Y2C9_9ACTN|nr:DUF6286 domain-containing protein [Planotetraspora thailandica]GII59457.1 hypothetical protein Pth03_78460 [Planotetraspora thailandica]